MPSPEPTSDNAKPQPPEGRRQLLVSFKAGQVVFQEGERGAEMFIIEAGEVAIVRRRAGEERSLAVFEAGDFFGEMSLLEDLPRSATARAVTDCRLLPVDASTFDLMLRDHPEVAIRIMRMLSRRLRQFDEAEQRAHAIAAGALHGLSHTSMEPAAVVAQVAEIGATNATPAPVVSSAELPAPVSAQAAPASAQAAPPSAHLVHPASGARLALAAPTDGGGDGDGEWIVGRRDPVTGLVPAIDLTAIDVQRSLSRRHARIVGRGGRYFVREEIGTANGTYVGATRLPTGKEEELRDGDALRFGIVELIFQCAPATPSAT